MKRFNQSLYIGIQIFAMSMISVSANAALYKWIDDEGNTTYSEKRPPDVEVEEISPPPKPPTDAGEVENLDSVLKKASENDERRKEKAEDARIEEENKKINKKNCEIAKNNLASYVRPQVRVEQEDGTRAIATEEYRQEQIAKSNEMVKEYCN
ncbi:MAG: hypothetical protein ACI9ZT_000432 [Gammaproteobacteria bacterium]|jgi:hypothetical protein